MGTALTNTLDIEFGPGGLFGEDLYATDFAGAVLRISPTGGVAALVTGLSSGGWLAFRGQEGLYFTDPAAGRLYLLRPTPRFHVSQPQGPGGSTFVNNDALLVGREYYNLFSLELCPGGPGMGPYLGLCATSPAALQFLITQILLPLGIDPFHFLAPSAAIPFGPYAIGPLTAEGMIVEISGGAITANSSVERFSIL
jgi:hypothetical protein